MGTRSDPTEIESKNPARRRSPSATSHESPAERLLFALCHELGNWSAGVRLQAHLLDDDLGSRELATAAVTIEDQAARIGTLLTFVRPLLDRAPPARPVAVAHVLGGVRHMLDDHGARGGRFEVDPPDPELGSAACDGDALQQLLFALALDGLDAAQQKGRVGVTATTHKAAVEFAVEDDGEEEPGLVDWPDQAPRGRALLCALAGLILGRRGGRVDVTRESGRTRVTLTVPRT